MRKQLINYEKFSVIELDPRVPSRSQVQSSFGHREIQRSIEVPKLVDIYKAFHSFLKPLLRVKKDATAEEIRDAYKRLAKQWHPDRFSNDPVSAENAKLKFQQIQEAYSVLSDDIKRVLYDGGIYEQTEDTDGFCHFLDELTSLAERECKCEQDQDKEEELQDLHETFDRMFQEGWFSMEILEPLWEMSEKFGKGKLEKKPSKSQLASDA